MTSTIFDPEPHLLADIAARIAEGAEECARMSDGIVVYR